MTRKLVRQWVAAKEDEREAIERRRKTEELLLKELAIKVAEEGTEYRDVDDYTVKVTKRHDHKIDADKLQEIAIENGLEAHLSTLFRWKPEMALTVWRAADPSITTPLLAAITTKPARPSFAVAKQEKR